MLCTEFPGGGTNTSATRTRPRPGPHLRLSCPAGSASKGGTSLCSNTYTRMPVGLPPFSIPKDPFESPRVGDRRAHGGMA